VYVICKTKYTESLFIDRAINIGTDFDTSCVIFLVLLSALDMVLHVRFI